MRIKMDRSAVIGILSVLAIGLYQFLGFTWAAIIVGTLGALLLYGWWEDGYFRRRGVKSTPTWVPFIGHMFKVFTLMEHIRDLNKRIYSAFPNERYVGMRQFTKPFVMITDLELIKQITIKDFDYFQDHVGVIDEKIDPLFGNNLVALKGQKWREMAGQKMQAKKGSLEHDEKKEESKETGFATVEESALGKEAIKRKWTDDEIIAQAVIFFLAGFDTTSNLLCFVAHELAINPEIQKKLQDEVDEVAAKNNGKLNYADLHSMKYMDMVVSETLRYWPPGVALDRKCVKTYTLPPPNETSSKGLTLKCNDGLWIPLYQIHHDPKYFENPEKFDPERFSEENKGSINPLAYLPFGIGPRNCIGSRFALMEAKAIIFQIFQNFTLVPTSKTSIPMKIKTSAFNFAAENGFWIGLKPRDV